MFARFCSSLKNRLSDARGYAQIFLHNFYGPPKGQIFSNFLKNYPPKSEIFDSIKRQLREATLDKRLRLIFLAINYGAQKSQYFDFFSLF